MKNTVFLMMNGKLITNEWYPTAEDAHKRFTELVRVSRKKMRDTDMITVYRLQDGYPMAMEEII